MLITSDIKTGSRASFYNVMTIWIQTLPHAPQKRKEKQQLAYTVEKMNKDEKLLWCKDLPWASEQIFKTCYHHFHHFCQIQCPGTWPSTTYTDYQRQCQSPIQGLNLLHSLHLYNKVPRWLLIHSLLGTMRDSLTSDFALTKKEKIVYLHQDPLYSKASL